MCCASKNLLSISICLHFKENNNNNKEGSVAHTISSLLIKTNNMHQGQHKMDAEVLIHLKQQKKKRTINNKELELQIVSKSNICTPTKTNTNLLVG